MNDPEMADALAELARTRAAIEELLDAEYDLAYGVGINKEERRVRYQRALDALKRIRDAR